jgi:hypothetical protein
METITLKPRTKKEFKAIKAFADVLEIPVKKKNVESPYNPEFVARMKRGDEDIKAGRCRTVTLEELDNLWK